MLISRTLRAPIAAAAVLVGVLLSAPAFAQAHIRGTLTAANDGTISVQTAKGETVSIKLASDAGLFLVTKAEMSASHARFMCLMNLCAVWLRGTIHGILNPSRT
jgi:hypothetical protein